MTAAAVETAATKAAQAADAAAAAKGLNDNAHGIDRFGYRVRCHYSAHATPHTSINPVTEPLVESLASRAPRSTLSKAPVASTLR